MGRALGVPLAERYPLLAERRVETMEPATLLGMARLLPQEPGTQGRRTP